MNINDLLVPSKPKIEPSHYQVAIYQSEPPIIVQAVAGSGKTHTLVEDSSLRRTVALMLAFNKGIANELCQRVTQAQVKTLNALGHGILTRKRPGAKLDAWRISKRVRQILNAEDYKLYGLQLCRAISLVKSNGDFQPDEESFLDAMNAYELDIPSDRQSSFARVCNRVFWEMYKNLETFDFDDQLYIPVREGWTFPMFDIVYVDEAQDLSRIQHLMVQALADRGAKIFAVGDRAQAIYGFRGATSSSMDDMKQQFRMKELPLSITYRCAQTIVEAAQRIVPHIEARPGAPEGRIISAEQYPAIGDYRPEDLIVCRNNAPIFGLALDFLRENKQCRVMSNFLETIESFINQFDCNHVKDFRIKLDAWYAKEKKACEDNYRMGKLAAIEDKYEVLSKFCENFQSVSAMISAIKALASSQFGPRISTVHKAKGLEAHRVYILRPDMLPSPKAQTPSALQAERNLEYVAITRAKEELVYLPREIV